jgi:multiple sugar transport system permease protein
MVGFVGYSTKEKFFRLIVYAILSIGAIFYIAPFYWMVSTSFKPMSEIFKWPPTLYPQHPTVENYYRVFEVVPMLRYYWNTLYVSLVIVFSQLLFASFAAYIFEKLRFPLKEFIFSCILFTMIIPFQSRLVPLYLLMDQLGLLDSHSAIIIPVLVTGFAVFFFRQNIKSIPDDLLDAAKIDGCTIFGRFYRIVIPLIQPAIGTIAIFTFMTSWTNFLWPLIVINTNHKMLLEQGLAFLSQGFETQEEGPRMAGASIAVIPILVVFIFAQKYFIRGIALTGLKS